MIFFTAIVGIYYARIEGLNTIRAGFTNLYRNKAPLYEIISGASIAVAACLLILPGFFTDVIGFILLIPFTRKYLISIWLKNNYKKEKKFDESTIDGEIIEQKEKKDDEF